MQELRRTLFLWLPLTAILYCSSAFLSADLPPVPEYEPITSDSFTIHTYQYEGSKTGTYTTTGRTGNASI